MSSFRKCLILGPDGSRRTVHLPALLSAGEWIAAPDWLVRSLGNEVRSAVSWYLIPSQARAAEPGAMPRLCLSPAVTAAASSPWDPRQARLKTERECLEKLNRESDHVRVEPVNPLPGSEPEHYRVTFLCKGIVAIDSSRQPVYGDKHVVEIYCDESFPSDVPRLRWVTPIWHPNIQHLEPKGVCVNKQEWLGGMRLEDLCRQMFEMVQYKNYHALPSKPWPLDKDVAQWVLQYAEPNGIVDKRRSISVDDKPFVRPTAAPVPRPQSPRVKLVVPAPQPQSPSRVKLAASAPQSQPPSRVKLVAKPDPPTQRVTIVKNAGRNQP
jgi:ubiquitin-protein ligase